MLSYQKAAPELRAICAKHGVPYVQQNVFKRLKMTADIMVCDCSLRFAFLLYQKSADITAHGGFRANRAAWSGAQGDGFWRAAAGEGPTHRLGGVLVASWLRGLWQLGS
jgi:hypothetical protein